jgi:hypothetical protein
MLLEFIATIAIGFGAAGVVMIFNWVVGGRLPKWLIPVAAGMGMIGFVVWSEYSWAGRVIATLPEEASVVSRNEHTAWFRPWTYIWPITNRITLIDHRFTRHHEDFPHLVQTAVVLLGRWEPGRRLPVVFDCERHLRADLRENVIITETGEFEGAEWLRLDPDAPMLRAACDGE